MKKLLLLSRRLIYIISLVLALSLVGNVQALTSDWTDATGDHLWSTGGNWDDLIIPTDADWVKINGIVDTPGAFIYSGFDAECLKIAIGYDDGSFLTVDGGTLTVVEDIVPGRNGDGTFNMISGTVNIGRDLDIPYSSGHLGVVNMTGGTINIVRDIELPDSSGQTGHLNMTGGTINIGDDLDMNGTGTGLLNLDGGTIILDDSYEESDGQLQMAASGGRIDIKFGTLILAGDEVSRVQGYVDNGWITGFGIVGNVTADVAGNTTTVTAIDPLQRTPAYGAVVPTGTVNLSWVNLPPISLPGYPVPTGVWVDVWFGADANSLTREVDAAGPGTTTADVSAPSLDEYIWRVDTYRHGDPAVMDYENDPNLVVDEGWTMYFVASNDTAPEVVIDTPPMATWIDEPTPLQVTITDDDKSDVTIVWTSDEDPNAVFDPPTTTYTKGTVTYPLVSTTSVTVDYHSGPFTVTATVSDANPLLETRSASVTVDCADNPCQATRGPVGLDAVHPADLVGDCMHNLADLAIIARDWLREDYKALDEPAAFTE